MICHKRCELSRQFCIFVFNVTTINEYRDSWRLYCGLYIWCVEMYITHYRIDHFRVFGLLTLVGFRTFYKYFFHKSLHSLITVIYGKYLWIVFLSLYQHNLTKRLPIFLTYVVWLLTDHVACTENNFSHLHSLIVLI